MSDAPNPGRSSARTRWVRMNAPMLSRKICQLELHPWMKSSAGAEVAPSPAGPVSRTLTRPPSTSSVCWSEGQSTSIQVASSPSAYVGSAPLRNSAVRKPPACRTRARATSGATVSTGVRMKIAIDIDSTLHHYWDQLSDASRRRFGIALPYDDQHTWSITLLRPEQIRACVAETHSDDRVLAAEPYPGAVAAVARWHDAGHFIHITSHRAEACQHATEAWLERIGLPYDELYCSDDKIARCREIGIDLLIDDSPVNLEAALDAGIAAATLVHPWNRELCETEDVIAGADWDELARRLEPVLA